MVYIVPTATDRYQVALQPPFMATLEGAKLQKTCCAYLVAGSKGQTKGRLL